MAESWCVAFGRYLKTLRKRQGLSLQEVCSLSQAFTETVNKGYLSRCENGKQSPSFSKIIPLARIYDVPADVLLERLELDMELERVGGPETGGKDFGELTEAGIDALAHGFGWTAYAFFRDSISRSMIDPVIDRYQDAAEQVACAHMNCATAARPRGRKRFALHEFQFVEATQSLGPRFVPVILERLSSSHRGLDHMELAREYGQRAIKEAETLGEPSRIGYAYSNHAMLAFESSKLEASAESLRKAYTAFKEAGLVHDCTTMLTNLAQVYFDLGRVGASRRTLLAADKVACNQEQHRVQVLSRILMGEINLLEHKEELARQQWIEAAEIAKKLNDKILRFKAEFFLFRQAHKNGDDPVARSINRRLRKLAHWIPRDTPELLCYRELIDGQDSGYA